jgi:Zn-dependent M28 family amino/carboxypeptidase
VRRLLLCFILGASASLAAQTAPLPYPPEQLLSQVHRESIRAHMSYLADDLLEGRGTGTRGYLLAAKYVAAQFEGMGLKPAGENGTYFQKVRFRRIETVPEKCSMSLTRTGKEQTLVWEKDFITTGDFSRTEASVSGPLVFVGYGISAPEFHYDDYAGLDAKGKIVVTLQGVPSSFPSAEAAYYSSVVVQKRNAVAHGAIGAIIIHAGGHADRVPFERLVRFFHEPDMHWLDAKGEPNDDVPGFQGYAVVNREIGASLFEGAPKSLKQALDDASANRPQGFPLNLSATIHSGAQFTETESPNVVAVLPGSDSHLRNEYVVYSAHADHLGIGEAIKGDTIYNGAVDNASGTAGVLEIARVLSSMPTAPRRSVLFLIVTGEEEGLLGSDAFAHSPTVPMEQIVANLNMDGISLFYDFRDLVALGVEHSSLSNEVNDVARHMGLDVSPDPLPEEVFFIRSDQYSFVKQGVPSVAIAEGFKTVDPKLNGKDIALKWESTTYHTPQDDMNQPLNFDAAVKCVRANLAVGYEVAQEDGRPHWNENDFFLQKFGRK